MTKNEVLEHLTKEMNDYEARGKAEADHLRKSIYYAKMASYSYAITLVKRIGELVSNTYESLGNPAPEDGDVIRCKHPKQELIGEAIYHVDFVDNETQLLTLSDRENGKGQRLTAQYMAWRFSLLRRSTAE